MLTRMSIKEVGYWQSNSTGTYHW